MIDPTIIVLDVGEITDDPKATVTMLPRELTVKHLKRRMMHAIVKLNLRYGLVAFYQKGILLKNHVKMGELPQGTVYCKLVKPLLYPIREIDDGFNCDGCGQDYFLAKVIQCALCS